VAWRLLEACCSQGLPLLLLNLSVDSEQASSLRCSSCSGAYLFDEAVVMLKTQPPRSADQLHTDVVHPQSQLLC
jgi:hypothetical protein